jgi:hypothetical protein
LIPNVTDNRFEQPAKESLRIALTLAGMSMVSMAHWRKAASPIIESLELAANKTDFKSVQQKKQRSGITLKFSGMMMLLSPL